jgi:hypothetical protein
VRFKGRGGTRFEGGRWFFWFASGRRYRAVARWAEQVGRQGNVDSTLVLCVCFVVFVYFSILYTSTLIERWMGVTVFSFSLRQLFLLRVGPPVILFFPLNGGARVTMISLGGSWEREWSGSGVVWCRTVTRSRTALGLPWQSLSSLGDNGRTFCWAGFSIQFNVGLPGGRRGQFRGLDAPGLKVCAN